MMPAFTKQHYEAVAAILRERNRELGDADTLVQRFADLFEQDNELFKREQFLRACRK